MQDKKLKGQTDSVRYRFDDYNTQAHLLRGLTQDMSEGQQRASKHAMLKRIRRFFNMDNKYDGKGNVR